MIQTIKNWLFDRIFRKEKLEIALLEQQLREKISNVSMEDVLFRKLKRFNSRLLDGVDISVSSKGDMDITSDIFEDAQAAGFTRDTFLQECQTLWKNRALPVIKDYFARNQILMTFKNASNTDQINFGRAVIVASQIERDEINRLHVVFEESKKPEEEFDKHDIGDQA